MHKGSLHLHPSCPYRSTHTCTHTHSHKLACKHMHTDTLNHKPSHPTHSLRRNGPFTTSSSSGSLVLTADMALSRALACGPQEVEKISTRHRGAHTHTVAVSKCMQPHIQTPTPAQPPHTHVCTCTHTHTHARAHAHTHTHTRLAC